MKKIYYLLSIFILFSCDPKLQEDETTSLKKEISSVAAKHKTPVKVNKEFLSTIESWKEYKNIEEFTVKFNEISPNEALSNALEMKRLVKQLKDSVKPKILNTPSFNSRINVLLNESERLADITFIPAIKTEEVNLQVEKIVAAFSALNSKINIVLSQKRFEDAIKISSDFIGLDSTKIDSVSRKSIDILEQKLIDKSRDQNKNNTPGLKKVKPNN